MSGCRQAPLERSTVIPFSEPSSQSFLENAFDSAETLFLSGDFMLGDATSIKYKQFDHYFIVFDGRQIILLFDENGTLISRICNIGNGPGEYLNISDAILSNDKLLLLCDNEKIVTYSKSGEYENEEMLSFPAERILKRSDSEYMFFVPRTEITPYGNDRIILTDGEYTPNGSFLPLAPSIMSYNSTVLDSTPNGAVICSQYFDPIYLLDDNSISYTFRIDFGTKTMPSEYIDAVSMADAIQLLPNIHAWFLLSAMMNEDYLLMNVAYQDGFECSMCASWLYNRGDETSIISSYDVQDELFSVLGYPLYLSEDNQVFYLVDCDLLKETEEIPSILSDYADSIDDGIHYMILKFNINYLKLSY